LSVSPVMFSSATGEHATPEDFFARCDSEFRFDLDAAATADNACCPRFWTIESNALLQEWTGRVWLNPPYGRGLELWLSKARTEVNAARAEFVVILVPARTDTRWFAEYVWDFETHRARPGVEPRFVKGRLRFGTALSCAPFPSMLVIMRRAKKRVRARDG